MILITSVSDNLFCLYMSTFSDAFKCIMNGFHACVHGFEFRTSHHMNNLKTSEMDVFIIFYNKYYECIIDVTFLSY